MGLRFDQLPPGITTSSADIVAVMQNGVTRQNTVSQLGASIPFTQSGTGAVARTVQAALRAIVRTGDYNAVANFDTANGLLTETIGLKRETFPSLVANAQWSLKSFDGGGGNDTFQLSFNGSPTLYTPNVLTEPQLWDGWETKFANSAARDPAFGTERTVERYLRFLPIGSSSSSAYLEPLFANVGTVSNKIIRADLRGERVTLGNTNDGSYFSYLECTSGYVKTVGSLKSSIAGDISSGAGFLAVSSPVHELISNNDSNPTAIFGNTHASTPRGVRIQFSAAAPDDNVKYFLHCVDNVADRCLILADGDLQNSDNSYGAISDERLKQDIVDAGSQWADIKGLRVRKYRFRSDVESGKDHVQIGLVAQEVLPISPGLVTDAPNGMLAVQYSVANVKLLKAFQEAQARIEKLEEQVKALLAR